MSNEQQTPTEDDLKKLPRLAIVAFAARCARRALPISEASSVTTPSELKAINEAISQSEQAACGGNIAAYASLDAAMHDARGAAYGRAANAADDVVKAWRGALNAPVDIDAQSVAPAQVACDRARAVANSITAAYAARIAAIEEANTVKAAACAAYSAYHAHVYAAIASFDYDSPRKAIQAMWRDYKLLLAGTKEHGWTDETPVPPSFFGPMWPEGDPEGWPPTETGNSDAATTQTPGEDKP